MTADALLAPWTGPFDTPPLDRLDRAAFRPAFDVALAEARAEIDTVAADPAPPDFENTVAALERAGLALDRVSSVFFALAGADADETIEAIQLEVAPSLARHRSETLLNPALFARVEAVWAAREGLAPEPARVLLLWRRAFLRAGASLDATGRARMGEIAARLAELGARFAQNVLAEERGWEMALGADDLAGLPPDLCAAMAAATGERGRDGWTLTLARSLVEPFLTFSDRRDLRERAWRGWVGRGANGGETDTRALIVETLKLRRERARLLGFDSYAAFKLDTEMAKTPEAARELLERVWAPARARAEADAEALEALIREDGGNHDLEPWDWRYYEEKRRRAELDFDAAEAKPYFPLDGVIGAAFDAAERLFGLSFHPAPDVATYHPDVRVWEVRRDGEHVGIYMGDHFARASKRSGAWCARLRSQHGLDGGARPIALAVMNFARSDGPALLTLDDARTLFHEFGHALHGLLSDVTYPSISGTAVARDFVELPSQLYEHWLTTPELLVAHARHAETGAPLPEALATKLRAAETWGQGFATVEYVASALVDLAFHEADAVDDPSGFERAALARIGMPPAIVPRHAATHFQHVFAGEGYAAGYYSYMWSEVMDADAFAAFEETGDVFDRDTAARLQREILSVGGGRDPAEAYLAFRGAAPDPDAMLRRRGLVAAALA